MFIFEQFQSGRSAAAQHPDVSAAPTGTQSKETLDEFIDVSLVHPALAA